MSETVLSVRELCVDFASTGRAVDSIDFDVHPGEIVAIVGESGSGKSVTAKAALGLLPDTASISGRVEVLGEDVLSMDERALRRVRGAKVAMVFQEPSTALNPVETVGWQIAEAIRAHRRVSRRQSRSRAVELLDLVDIAEPQRRVDDYPHQLSGGQKQRVVIALALANEPDMIIADEPTTALDVTVQAEILAVLGNLRDSLGRAVLLITHNMGVVADLADRVVVMHRGQVVETGDVVDLFERPSAPYTRQLLASVPRLHPQAVASPPPRDEPVLEFTNLVVEYPGRLGRASFRAIDGVDLTLARGEVVGLVGESGSGKSTLGRTAVGLVRPTSGTARALGCDLVAAAPRQVRELRRSLGIVFQDPASSLDPRRSVADAIGEPLEVHGLARGAKLRARVAELLDAVQLPAHAAERRPGELSGGQRQRVSLARALSLDPALIVADEPTSALDVSVQAAVLDLFRDLQQRFDFACLFISHDLAVVDEVAGRVAVLQAGRIVEVGDPATVLRTPQMDYTKALVEAVPVPDPLEQRRRRTSPERKSA